MSFLLRTRRGNKQSEFNFSIFFEFTFIISGLHHVMVNVQENIYMAQFNLKTFMENIIFASNTLVNVMFSCIYFRSFLLSSFNTSCKMSSTLRWF